MPYTYPSPLTALERTPQGHQELDRLHLWTRTIALISGLTAMGFLRHWGDVVFVTLSHPKQSPTEHCEAELKLTAGVVVFSVGVNEGSPQASRPTGPAEHALCSTSISYPYAEGASTGTSPLVRFARATSHLVRHRVLLLSCPTLPSLGVSEALGGRRVRNTITSQTEPNRAL